MNKYHNSLKSDRKRETLRDTSLTCDTNRSGSKKKRLCLGCGENFLSEYPYYRTCEKCRLANEKTALELFHVSSNPLDVPLDEEDNIMKMGIIFTFKKIIKSASLKLIPWRVSNFFNVHFHDFYMLTKFGTTNLNTRRHWDNRFRAKNYNESEKTADVFTEIERLITPRSSVLDVGVGSGQFLKQIKATRTPDVFGLDISSVAIEQLREEGIDGCCCELPAKPSLNRQFDFVIAKALLEHLKYPRESLRTLAELVREDGKLIISVPNDCLGPEDEPEHLRKYNKASLREELSDTFDVKHIDVIGSCLLAVCVKRHPVTGV